MPTRNRPELLEYSLRSALEQSLDTGEFEVVVSDNSSDDRTELLMKEFDAPNLKYVRTGASLNMPDSWEFAARQGAGRYITFLCDDDARPPSSLALLAQILDMNPSAELIAWNSAVYIHQDWLQPWTRNHLVFPPFSGDIVEEASQDALRRIFRFEMAGLPKMLNSACSRDVLDRIRNRIGRVFLPTSPDYTFMAASAAVTRFLLMVDRPLHLAGVSKHSIGSSSMMGGSEASRTFYSEFGVPLDELHPDVPVSPASVTSGILQSLINVSRSELLAGECHPDMPRYFSVLYSELRNWERSGVDIKPQLRALDEKLASESANWARDLRTRMRSDVPKRWLRRRLAHLSSMERRIRSLQNTDRSLNGADHGFSNILECARKLESIIPEIAAPVGGQVTSTSA